MMTKTFTLTLSEKQAQTISTACELLSRIQSGQILEAFGHLPLKKDIDWGVYHEIRDDLTKRMPEIFMDGIDGYGSFLGVGNTKLPESRDIAWDLYQVIRHHLSWQKAVEDGIVESMDSPREFLKMMGVNYDTPMKFGCESLAKMEMIDD
jgi:hypothetical protein